MKFGKYENKNARVNAINFRLTHLMKGIEVAVTINESAKQGAKEVQTKEINF